MIRWKFKKKWNTHSEIQEFIKERLDILDAHNTIKILYFNDPQISFNDPQISPIYVFHSFKEWLEAVENDKMASL